MGVGSMIRSKVSNAFPAFKEKANCRSPPSAHVLLTAPAAAPAAIRFRLHSSPPGQNLRSFHVFEQYQFHSKDSDLAAAPLSGAVPSTGASSKEAAGAKCADDDAEHVMEGVACDTPDHVAAAAMKCLEEDNRSPQVLDRIAAAATGMADKFDPYHMAAICTSFAKLDYFSVSFKSAIAKAVVSKMTVSLYSASFHAVPRPPYAYLLRIVMQLEGTAIFCRDLYGCYFGILIVEINRMLAFQDFRPELLADVAWSFGQLQYYDFELFAALAQYLRTHAPAFDPTSLSKLLWTFGRVGFNDDHIMDIAKVGSTASITAGGGTYV